MDSLTKTIENCTYGLSDKNIKKSTKTSLHILRANALYKQDSLVSMIYDLKQALSDENISEDDKVWALVRLGNYYRNISDHKWISEHGNNFMRIDSTNRDSLLFYAVLNLVNDEYESAIFYCNKLQQIDTSKRVRIEIFDCRGTCYVYLKKYDLAINDYENYLILDPKSPVVCNNLAWTYFLSKRYDKALNYANKGILYGKKDDHYYGTRGGILYKQKKYQTAILDFNKSLEINPENTHSYYFRGLCYLKLNKKKEACSDFAKVLNTNYELLEGETPVEELIKLNCQK
jgi:tetratricopeptide (TPR) repeat protein